MTGRNKKALFEKKYTNEYIRATASATSLSLKPIEKCNVCMYVSLRSLILDLGVFFVKKQTNDLEYYGTIFKSIF